MSETYNCVIHNCISVIRSYFCVCTDDISYWYICIYTCAKCIVLFLFFVCVCVQMCSLKAENMEREKDHRTKAHTQQRQFNETCEQLKVVRDNYIIQKLIFIVLIIIMKSSRYSH